MPITRRQMLLTVGSAAVALTGGAALLVQTRRRDAADAGTPPAGAGPETVTLTIRGML